MNWKSTVAVSGLGVLATMLGVSSGPQRVTEGQPAVPASTSSRNAALISDIQHQADRLHARLQDDTEYRDPVRDPFRFGARVIAPPAPRTSQSVGALPVVPVLPAVPPIELAGIASDGVADAIQRTAILITPNGVLYVREGEAVGSEYRVSKVEDEAAELVSRDGTVRRLTLGPSR